MLYSENLFKLEHEWEDRNMRYTLDIIVVSIGIIEFFQIGINLDFSCILIYSLCMYAYISYSINFDWYLIFHTYIFVYDKLEFQLCFN